MDSLSKFLVNCIAVVCGAYLLKGIHIENSFWTIIVVALILSILNTFLKPLLIILTIPVTLITFGLFLLVINALIILLADKLIDNFAVDGFWWALAFSLIMSLVNSFFGKKDKKNKNQFNQ